MNRFTAILLLSLTMVLTGCHTPEVKFSDMRPAPTAAVSSDTVTIQVGWDYFNSALFVCPKAKVEGQTVYVFGYRALRQHNRELVVRLPASVSAQTVAVEWLNPDGSHVSIPTTR